MSSSSESTLQTSEQSPSSSSTKRWASLADRLNPNRPSFDAKLKASWKTMSKKERKRIIAQDKKAIQEFKTRGTSQPLPFAADTDDHCETSPLAYTHIVPILNYIAERLHKKPCDLKIYDPYYCAGGVVHHLNKLGFHNVYNKAEDFYNVIATNMVPPYDVLLTNPPYSGDHFDKLLSFLSTKNNKPALLLLPEHFSKNKSYAVYNNNASDNNKFCFMTPPERYHYWTPEGMRPEQQQTSSTKKNKRKRHKNLVLGSRNSPFASHWFICMEPLVTNDMFVSLVHEKKIKLVDGCCMYNNEDDIVPTTFNGAVQSNDDSTEGGDACDKKKKKKKRRKGGGGIAGRR